MSFRTSQPQPFTAAEAAQLDVGTIVAEISRLGNSLTHLSSTQDELRSALADDDDDELRAALNENEGVIASQTERVEMLRHVLVEKVGPDSLAHYGVTPPSSTIPPSGAANPPSSVNGSVANGTSMSSANGAGAETGAPANAGHASADVDEGLHL